MCSRKTFSHPEVGLITVDCDVLVAQGSDLRLVVYTAPPDSPDARALALLADPVAQVGDRVALDDRERALEVDRAAEAIEERHAAAQ